MKKSLSLVALLSLAIFAAPPALQAAGYPDKPVNMIIAFTAGGSSDVQARIMEKYWGKYAKAGWNFIYKTGAGGAVGFGEIAKAKPDGYTIGGCNTPHIMLQPLSKQAQFTINDFTYLCQVVNDPQTVTVRKDSPFKSVKALFDHAKANPGKLKVGLVGPNSGHHLMFLDVQQRFPFPATPIFYKGAADQNAALLGGEIDAMFGNLNDVMRTIDELNVLAVAAEKRNDFLPATPTMKEAGFNVVSDIRRGFVAPAGLGGEQRDYLRSVFDKIGADPGYAADMKKAGQPHEYMNGDDFAAYVKKQNVIATELFKKITNK
jgi:tripartite-type tricarboxylate transporter receptor subunit TctC